MSAVIAMSDLQVVTIKLRWDNSFTEENAWQMAYFRAIVNSDL